MCSVIDIYRALHAEENNCKKRNVTVNNALTVSKTCYPISLTIN